jgi:hypothetical protein
LTPPAPTETSMPLAFQKRVSGVTYFSKGVLMNTVMSMPLPSADRS